MTTDLPPPRLVARLPWVPLALVATALLFVLMSVGSPELRADSPGYFAYVRSLVLDHDLDFANEWAHWGLKPLPTTPTGRMSNPYSIGPALIWMPFFLLAHVYVWLASV